MPFCIKRFCAGAGSRGGWRRICWYPPKRLSTHSREKRKWYDRWVMGAGTGAGGSGAVVATEASVDEVVPLVLAVLPAFSLSFAAGPGLFDLALCFEPPPMRLRRMFHLPLPESSSGKSCESVDKEDGGRTSAAGINGAGGEGFRWLGCWTTPSNERKGPLLATIGLSLRMMRKRRPGAGLQACVDG
jgi:hypothetical protein